MNLPELPDWLTQAVRRAEAAAAQGTSPRLAVVVLREEDGRRVDDLVVLRRSDFRTWHAVTIGGYRGEGDYPEYD